MTSLKPAEPISNDRREHATNKFDIISNAKSKRMTNLIAYVALLAICITIFEPLISTLSANAFDYVVHLRWASEMELGQKLILPHPLYHLLSILTKKIFLITYAQSSTVIIVSSIFFLSVLNYRILAESVHAIIAILFSVCLLLVTPLQLFFPIDQHLYFGYIGISIYHSPTMLL